MSLLKWYLILLYWLWLDYRNVKASNHDWRLAIQILINTAVIAVIILEEFT